MTVDALAFLAAALEAAPERPAAVRRRRRAPGAEDTVDADDPMPWRVSAACRDTGFEAFYPNLSPTDRWDAAETAPARSLCRICPVLVDCLSYALANREDDGIWGGTDPYTRAAMRRSMGGRIPSGNVPVEPEIEAEIVDLAPETAEPTDAELAEIDVDPDSGITDDLDLLDLLAS